MIYTVAISKLNFHKVNAFEAIRLMFLNEGLWVKKEGWWCYSEKGYTCCYGYTIELFVKCMNVEEEI